LLNQKGITSALAVLIVLIVVIIAGMYYLAGPPPSNTPAPHTYFEDLSFQLASNKTWRVAVPISDDGTLHLSISSDLPVYLYVKNGNSYLLDTQIMGAGNFTIQVTEAMGLLEVGVTNFGSQPATVQQFTCVWTS
jgi:hypothetical protein